MSNFKINISDKAGLGRQSSGISQRAVACVLDRWVKRQRLSPMVTPRVCRLRYTALVRLSHANCPINRVFIYFTALSVSLSGFLLVELVRRDLAQGWAFATAKKKKKTQICHLADVYDILPISRCRREYGIVSFPIDHGWIYQTILWFNYIIAS
jgi:hypothetical protein